MSNLKPTLPKGMRDFLPETVAKRRYITSIIQSIFEKYGFQPIDTPVMEKLTTLTGKYGEEGDKLLFKVLDNGDFAEKVAETDWNTQNSKVITPKISAKGLRYDLTVPLARYVIQNKNELTFPFRRYHIAPVWRADRPQKGRYREFYQCDADVIGSDSLINEVELVQIYSEVFHQLGLNVTIKYNSRKLLKSLMETVSLAHKSTEAITILDKLDKIGLEKVLAELEIIGLTKENQIVLKSIIERNDYEQLANGDNKTLGALEINAIKNKDITNAVFDISLARGLDYYTGCIFEVVANDYEIGSIGGGGRYDNLTEMFTKEILTGVGISFGLDRIFDVMEALKKFPESVSSITKLLFVYFDEKSQDYAFTQLQKVRNAGISAEIYPDSTKLGKQMKYANDKNIPFVCVVGDKEMDTNILTLKNMESGEQQAKSLDEIVGYLKK